jgi:hypothetical protein
MTVWRLKGLGSDDCVAPQGSASPPFTNSLRTGHIQYVSMMVCLCLCVCICMNSHTHAGTHNTHTWKDFVTRVCMWPQVPIQAKIGEKVVASQQISGMIACMHVRTRQQDNYILLKICVCNVFFHGVCYERLTCFLCVMSA